MGHRNEKRHIEKGKNILTLPDQPSSRPVECSTKRDLLGPQVLPWGEESMQWASDSSVAFWFTAWEAHFCYVSPRTLSKSERLDCLGAAKNNKNRWGLSTTSMQTSTACSWRTAAGHLPMDPSSKPAYPLTPAVGQRIDATSQPTQNLWPAWLVKGFPCWSQPVKIKRDDSFFKSTGTNAKP